MYNFRLTSSILIFLLGWGFYNCLEEITLDKESWFCSINCVIYNLIRSRNTKSTGIFLSHWVMDVSGKTEKINEYKDDLECMPGKVQTQYHSIGWMLEDANSDGYMEFYALIVNACEESDLHPQDATLVVFTNIPDLQLQGETYSLLKDDSENLGGKFEASAELQKQGEMLEKAEEAWESYIHETE